MSAIQGAVGERFGRFSPGQIIALIAALAAGLVLGWYGFKTAFGDGTQTAAPITGVTTVRPQTVSQFATTSGNVVAPANTKLTFPIAGRVAGISVKQGQTVKQGDVVATLDQTQLKIALDQAQSQQNTAQARLDALSNGATPDVIAAAQAAVSQSQAAEKSAEGQLSQAQTGSVTANNGVGTAANAITTAQNQVQTAVNNVANSQSQVASAQSQIASSQANLQQAQSAYQNLLNGPTPQDVAVSQAAVDAAATNLQSAEDTYNRLVNHTDLLTRPETSALIQASSAYQSALANYANAQPQPTNQYDVASAQLAVSTAQAQVNLANQNVASAQQSLVLAQQSNATANAPTSSASGCVVAVQSGVCIGAPPEPIPPSTSSQNAQQSALITAQNQVNQATATAISSESSYQQALNNLQKLLNPTNNTNYQGLQAAIDSSRQQYDIALQNYQNYLNLPDLSTRPETTALNSARASYNNAVAAYNLKVAPPKDTDLANAQAQIQTAQAQIQSAQAALDAANAGVANANVAVGSAQVGVSNAGLAYQNAQATAGSAGAAVNTAQSQIPAAQANVTSAQAKLEQLNAPPLQTDLVQAMESVNQAKLTVQKSQSDLDSSVITAPFPGLITSVNVNPGDQVGSGTQIAGLVDPNNVELDAQVDETTYGQIKVGMPVLVRFDVLPNQPLTGTITKIIPSGTTTQGVVTFPIVITLNTPPGTTLPNGASASQIQIVLQARSNVLAVPARDVYRDPTTGKTTVDVVKNGTERVPTPVEVGLVTDTLTEITSGLKAGDQVAQPLPKKGSSSSAFGANGVQGLGGGGGGGARPAGR
jgi:HlyD family secretion protein